MENVPFIDGLPITNGDLAIYIYIYMCVCVSFARGQYIYLFIKLIKL